MSRLPDAARAALQWRLLLLWLACLLLPDSVIENPSLTHDAAPGALHRVDSTGVVQ